jgi:hypothetical protein
MVPALMRHRLAIAIATLLAIIFTGMLTHPMSSPAIASSLTLLTDPFLQLPTADSVRVVWFTEFEGDRHWVEYGPTLNQTAIASTSKLSRVREDQSSRVVEQRSAQMIDPKPVFREIWRHEAEVIGLKAGERWPYRVVSVAGDRGSVTSQEFTLTPLPTPGQALQILLTSDHQLKAMTAANLQKVVETVGRVDGIFFAGDLVNTADRASEWFDDSRGGAFFPALQGRAQYEINADGTKTIYRGGEIIQHAPLFPAIGNHEVMGRFSMDSGLNDQFDDAIPRAVAEGLYREKASILNPTNDPAIQDAWLKNNSFNTDTYEELFSLPEVSPGGKRYYAITFGDIRLIVLYATCIWRGPQLTADTKGRYREREADLQNPERWGYGQHIFEAIAPGSPQYTWLQQELTKPEFQQAKYKIVMFHHPPHSLGGNVVPAYTDPVQIIERDAQGNPTAIRYEYPQPQNYLIRDVVPLLEQAGVQLVFYGHSHLWNRFMSTNGTHFLESSNVGNSYGAFLDKPRPVPSGFSETYAATGNPNGLEPIVPAIAPLYDRNGDPLPYIASNEITAFSILNTGTGVVSSYRFDTRTPDAPVIKFDEFRLTS